MPLGRNENGAGFFGELSESNEDSLGRNIELPPEPCDLIDIEALRLALIHTSNGHEDFGSSDIAKSFQLPLVPLLQVRSDTIADSHSTIRKKRVGDLVSD